MNYKITFEKTITKTLILSGEEEDLIPEIRDFNGETPLHAVCCITNESKWDRSGIHLPRYRDDSEPIWNAYTLGKYFDCSGMEEINQKLFYRTKTGCTLMLDLNGISVHATGVRPEYLAFPFFSSELEETISVLDESAARIHNN